MNRLLCEIIWRLSLPLPNAYLFLPSNSKSNCVVTEQWSTRTLTDNLLGFFSNKCLKKGFILRLKNGK